MAIGRKPRRAPEDQEGWAGLSTDPVMQCCRRRALGPSYRWSHVQLQSHRPVSEPIAALQSGLGSRILLLLAAHLPKRDPISFLILLFLFPPPVRRRAESVSSFPCVRVVAVSSSSHKPTCQGRKETSATCLIAAPSPPAPGRQQLLTPGHPPPGQANPDCSVAVQRSASHLTYPGG